MGDAGDVIDFRRPLSSAKLPGVTSLPLADSCAVAGRATTWAVAANNAQVEQRSASALIMDNIICTGYRETVRGRPAVFIALFSVVPWSALAAQGDARPAARTEVYAGSELETYLRDLQVAGVIGSYPWSARRFTAAEVDHLLPADSVHPWAARYDWSPAPARGLSVAAARPEVAGRFNSGFPYGYNDGAVWAGRGATFSVQGGVSVRYGPVAASVVPLAFWASNAGFQLQPNGQTGAGQYADGLWPLGIDHPQRFGDHAYSAVDGGQSALEVSKWGLAAGVSTANDFWGPASDFPVILGNNAAGIPRVFAGTAVPLDLWIVRVHVRSFFGRLTQSAYSPQTGEQSVRAASGAVVVVMPRWPEGLELGVTRFIHSVWAHRTSVLDELRSPFRFGTRDDSAANELASIFFRWVVPRASVEIYGEYGTEDYRYNLREIFVEPDHIAGYTIGLRHVGRRSTGVWRVLRAEIQDLHPGTLVQARPQGPFYLHWGGLLQGHTYQGQILGSEFGLGGAAATVAMDWYHPGGRWTVAWSRLLRGDLSAPTVATAPQNPRGLDVMHTLGVEGLFFRGRYEIRAGVTAVYEFNRDFQRDAFNLNLTLAVRAGLR